MSRYCDEVSIERYRITYVLSSSSKFHVRMCRCKRKEIKHLPSIIYAPPCPLQTSPRTIYGVGWRADEGSVNGLLNTGKAYGVFAAILQTREIKNSVIESLADASILSPVPYLQTGFPNA